jgi:tRNA-intron lyase
LLGDFVGTLPKHCAQNQYLALPLVLSYDELTFGVSQGFFRVLSDSPDTDYISKTPEHAAAASEAFYAAREAECERQARETCRAQEAERRRQLAKMSTQDLEEKRNRKQNGTGRAGGGGPGEIAGKVGKKRRRSMDAAAVRNTRNEAEPPTKVAKVGDNGIFQRMSTFVIGVLHRLIPSLVPEKLSGSSDAQGRAKEDEKAREVSEAARLEALRERALQQARSTAVAVTSTETRPGERARSTMALRVYAPEGISAERLAMRGAVFRDLYSKGYYMSCGAKFGADFLAYAGEPLLYHAALAVIVVHADDPVSPHDLVALGRLGDATKKRTVLAYIDGESIQYIGVQWEETLP